MSLTFAAIDVETANSERGSICSFGVAVVRDGRVAEKHHFLTRPPRELDWFDGFNVMLHGIRHEDVADQPRFQQRLAQVLDIVGNLPVVAHNAAFDIGAIRMGCDADDLDWPTLTYACSLIMSRRAGLALLSYRLPVVCEALGLPSGQHHRADDDAEAAARVVLALAERQQAENLEDLARSLMVRLGKITHTEWTGCIRAYAGAAQRPTANLDADPDHPLFGKSIAFTGGISIVRADAWALVADLGATPLKAPNKHTDFLVIGDGFAGTSAADFRAGKAAAAVRINAKGGHIEVLTEGDLLDLPAETTTSGSRVQAPV
ncbi:MAG TPA: exonuclease domain-containing protein [Mycobacteriales bacterium]|nr:exonuclease domain-containing protein [Mycobacteriales bacterium]